MPSALFLVLTRFADAAAQEHVENLAHAVDQDAALVQPVEQHALGRRHGVIVAVGGAREIARRADERPRDDAAHFVRPAQNLARGFADLVQLPERDHLFVRGHLEDAVGRGVNDGRAGAHVLGAQFLDDLGARGGLVAQRAAADAPLEFVHDFRRETVRDRAETAWPGECPPFPNGRWWCPCRAKPACSGRKRRRARRPAGCPPAA